MLLVWVKGAEMSTTKSLNQVLHSISTNCTNSNKLKPISTISTDNTKLYQYECDELYSQLPDLVNIDYHKWFLRHFYRLGKDKVLQLAALARADGNHPPKYFAKLLKETQ